MSRIVGTEITPFIDFVTEKVAVVFEKHGGKVINRTWYILENRVSYTALWVGKKYTFDISFSISESKFEATIPDHPFEMNMKLVDDTQTVLTKLTSTIEKFGKYFKFT